MKVHTKELYREFIVIITSQKYKQRSAKITMELELDGKWHHCKTDYEFKWGSTTMGNLADMVFIGKVAEEVIKIKQQLNRVIDGEREVAKLLEIHKPKESAELYTGKQKKGIVHFEMGGSVGWRDSACRS